MVYEGLYKFGIADSQPQPAGWSAERRQKEWSEDGLIYRLKFATKRLSCRMVTTFVTVRIMFTGGNGQKSRNDRNRFQNNSYLFAPESRILNRSTAGKNRS